MLTGKERIELMVWSKPAAISWTIREATIQSQQLAILNQGKKPGLSK